MELDSALVELVGSRARLLSLAVLASAQGPMSGYRIARVADIPRQKVYPILRRAVNAGLVRKTDRGYILNDGDVRNLLRRRIRLEWSGDGPDSGPDSSATVSTAAREDFDWFDADKYVPSPRIARRYAKEFRRAPGKGPSRKTDWDRTSRGR